MNRIGSRFAVPLLAVLAAATGCRQPWSAGAGWPEDGADAANTRFVPTPGRGDLESGMVKLWEAEDFAVPQFLLDPLSQAGSCGLLTGDIVRDEFPEVMVRASPSVLLDRYGVCVRAATGGGTFQAFDNRPGAVPAMLECSLNTILVHSGSRRRRLACGRPVVQARTVALRRPGDAGPLLVTVELTRCVAGADGVASRLTAVTGRDFAAGRQLWSFETGASLLRVWAMADVNRDGATELIVGSYNFEHGVECNGIGDTSYAVVLCLNLEGELLWQRAFGRHRHVGTQALVADVDGDSYPEVVVAAGSWDRRFGQVAVLDGRQGRVKASFEAATAFTGLGAADLTGDGRVDICATTAGGIAQVAVFHCPTPDSLELLRVTEYASPDSAGFVDIRLGGLNDLDGDGSVEIVASMTQAAPIDRDPYFYPMRYADSRIVILNSRLSERTTVELAEPARAVIIADLTRTGRNGLLVMTDRLEYYALRR
jgi:hypothetical protein